MDNQTSFQSKRTVILLIILIVSLIVAGFFWFNWFNQNNKSDSRTNQTAGFKVNTKDLGKAELLSGFPANLPQLPGTKILKNTEYSTSDGRLQSTKKFIAPLSIQSSLKKYSKFFQDLGWANGKNDSTKSPLLLTKGRDILMIVVRPDVDTTSSQVEITIIQQAPSSKQVSSR